MLLAGIFTQKNAEKNGKPRAYLARLVVGPHGGIDREFASRRIGKTNRRQICMAARPGDVFEARRWWWDGDSYIGGAAWFGAQPDGTMLVLTREEAFFAVLHGPISPPPPPPGSVVLAAPLATRVPPKDCYLTQVA